jgi:hypothetical protein
LTPFDDQAAMIVQTHLTWSPSKLFCYEGCPAQAKYKYLDKLPDPGGPALQRGTLLHAACEVHIRGGAALLPELKASEALLTRYREAYLKQLAFSELELAFRHGWERCKWMDPYVKARFKLDAVMLRPSDGVLEVVDLKTGKLREDADSQYQDQLSMYCLALHEALHDPTKRPGWAAPFDGAPVKVKASLWFIDAAKEVEFAGGVVGPEQREMLREFWEKRVGVMLGDTLHSATPTFKCRWCPFRKGSGPCKFGG